MVEQFIIRSTRCFDERSSYDNRLWLSNFIYRSLEDAVINYHLMMRAPTLLSSNIPGEEIQSFYIFMKIFIYLYKLNYELLKIIQFWDISEIHALNKKNYLKIAPKYIIKLNHR